MVESDDKTNGNIIRYLPPEETFTLDAAVFYRFFANLVNKVGVEDKRRSLARLQRNGTTWHLITRRGSGRVIRSRLRLPLEPAAERRGSLFALLAWVINGRKVRSMKGLSR